MGRSSGRSAPLDLSVDLNGNFRLLLLELIWADQLADVPLHLPVHLNGKFTFLLSQIKYAISQIGALRTK